jgi:subtilisin family serine protease
MERVLIQFAPGQKTTVKGALEDRDAQIHYEFDEFNVMVATLSTGAISELDQDPSVVLIEPDAPRYAQEQIIPYGVDSVEAVDIWDADRDGVVDPGAPTGSGRTVCIIDSGVYRDHEDFSGVNFVGGYPSGWDTDGCGHGTHVAGTIAAAHNTTGVVGVTPGGVSLYIIKVFNENCVWTYSSGLFEAAMRCRDAGADIVNISIAGDYYSAVEEMIFESLYVDDGILSIASAGNLGGTEYLYPASHDSVVSVTAVDQNNLVASFSQKNDRVEIAAPGVSILSTYNDGSYAYMSGTSMAAPHVAAAAAVVWSSDTSKTNAEIRDVLTQTALDLGAPGQDDEYGAGLIQTYDAYQAFNPTPVELVRFEARADGSAVQLEWETASEIDNLGFNLLRSESVDGSRTQLNSNLIPSQAPGSPEGAVYQFVDEPGVAGTYYYWLEEVDLYGRATQHGPASVETPIYRVFLPFARR